jgi:hypothetical protein
MLFRWRAAMLLVACGSLASCRFLTAPSGGQSPLKPLRPSPDTVSLEVFSARFAPDDRRVSDELWTEVDEQQLSIETRRAVAQHGLRVGVLGPHPPAALVELLKITEKPVDASKRGEHDAAQLLEEPTVTMRAIFTRTGWRNEIIASKTIEELPLLERDGDQVRGHTFSKAEGRFVLRAYPQADGLVRLEVTPELQYGEAQQKWCANDGVLRQTSARPKKTFDGLDLNISLAAGQMLLITCLPGRQGSVGHWFFMEGAQDRCSQKLLAVRIAQATTDRSFAEPSLAERLDDVVAQP